MKKLELKTPFLWLIFTLWVIFGQLVSYCVLNDLVPTSLLEVGDALAKFVPSIARLGNNYAFGLSVARRIASICLLFSPILFAILLLADVEESVSGVRQKGKEAKGSAIFAVIGLSVFISGFGIRGPGKAFYTDVSSFSFLSSLITYGCAYFFRLVVCLRFKR